MSAVTELTELMLKHPDAAHSRDTDPRVAANSSSVRQPPCKDFPLRTGEVLFSDGQKQALLKMRCSDLSKEVLRVLRERREVKTIAADYKAMARLGLAIDKGSFHVLTSQGRWRADKIAREWSRELGLHVFTYDFGRPGAAAFSRCSCGWVAYRSRALPNFQMLMGKDARMHLAHVEKQR